MASGTAFAGVLDTTSRRTPTSGSGITPETTFGAVLEMASGAAVAGALKTSVAGALKTSVAGALETSVAGVLETSFGVVLERTALGAALEAGLGNALWATSRSTTGIALAMTLASAFGSAESFGSVLESVFEMPFATAVDVSWTGSTTGIAFVTTLTSACGVGLEAGLGSVIANVTVLASLAGSCDTSETNGNVGAASGVSFWM
jgi:hypothetical protein